MTTQDQASRHGSAHADLDEHRRPATHATELPRDVLSAVTGGQTVPAPGDQPEPNQARNKNWLRQSGEFARDASGGFASGLLGFGPDDQLWGESNRVSREFGGFGEFLGTRRGGRRVPRR